MHQTMGTPVFLATPPTRQRTYVRQATPPTSQQASEERAKDGDPWIAAEVPAKSTFTGLLNHVHIEHVAATFAKSTFTKVSPSTTSMVRR